MRLDPQVSNLLDELTYTIKLLKAQLRNVPVKKQVKKVKVKKRTKKNAEI